MEETWVRSLGWENPLEKRIATHSSILVHGIMELQSIRLQRVRHDLKWLTCTRALLLVHRCTSLWISLSGSGKWAVWDPFLRALGFLIGRTLRTSAPPTDPIFYIITSRNYFQHTNSSWEWGHIQSMALSFIPNTSTVEQWTIKKRMKNLKCVELENYQEIDTEQYVHTVVLPK